MKNRDYIEISMDDYNKIKSRIDLMITEEELIESHKRLVGKTCKSDYYEIKDCGAEFIKELLSRDWKRSIFYHYSQGAENFIQSKYLSDYFKSSIRELLSSEELSEEVINAINSDKLINEMSAEELSGIYSSISDFYRKSEQETSNIAGSIMSFLYKLNGKGVVSFIKNNVNNRDLASHILLTSGLNDRASFYSGRGVNYGDLNEKNLIAIFGKLLKLDQSYATEFVEMVKQMKTLGATEFINSFMNFADSGFKSEHLKNEDSNISLDGLYGQARDTVAFVSIPSAMSRGNDMDYQISLSEGMKHSFISRIRPILIEMNSKFTYDYNQSYNPYGKSSIKRK